MRCRWSPELPTCAELHVGLMGYAGYAPTKYARTLNAVQLALKAVQDEAAYDLISKLMKNIAVNPVEAKYRRIGLSNARIQAVVASAPAMINALTALGWEADPQDDQFLLCSKTVRPTMAEVRLVDEAKAEYLKDARASKRSAKARALTAATGSTDQQRIVAQLAADRAERAAVGPVVGSSMAKALPNKGTMTASEAGCSGSTCDC